MISRIVRIICAVCAALAAFASQADVIWYAQNQAGGQLQLTDVKCSAGGFVIYSTNLRNSNVVMGCYVVDNVNVIVFWDDGTRGAFPKSIWIKVGGGT